MPYTNFPSVNDILNGVSQDIRQQLLNDSTTPGQAILIDYTNRTHKQMLRFSRWGFLLSEPQYFVTEYGQSNYWLGASGQAPAGFVDTGLNLIDVDKIKKDSVIDISNLRALKWMSQQVYGPTLVDRTGAGRPGLPAIYVQNPNDPFQLLMFPPPKNDNVTQPVPQVPICQTLAGGALANRTYFVKVTYVDQLGGESTAPAASAQQFITANNLCVVKSPKLPFGVTVSGVQYNRYNVYIVQATSVDSSGNYVDNQNELKQNASPITIGTDFVEPTTGLVTNLGTFPTTNTLQNLGGFLIKFQYYKNRATLTSPAQLLQVPEDYKDVVIHGVNFLAWKLLGKEDEAKISQELYQSGLREMIWDKNLFPEGVEFMRPDGATYINQQILGFLPQGF